MSFVAYGEVGQRRPAGLTDNFGNSFGNFFKNLWREGTNPASYEALVDGYNFADKHNSFSEQTGMFLFRSPNRIIVALKCRTALRGDGDQNDILTRVVECVGGNNQSRTLLHRTEIGKGERNKDNITALIAGHISNLARYSRNRTTVPQALKTRACRYRDRLILVAAQASVAYPRALTALSLVQFGAKTSFAYAGSIPYVDNVRPIPNRNTDCYGASIYPSTTNSLRSFGYPSTTQAATGHGGAGNRALSAQEVHPVKYLQSRSAAAEFHRVKQLYSSR